MTGIECSDLFYEKMEEGDNIPAKITDVEKNAISLLKPARYQGT